MSHLIAIILGLVQGLTEFIPVSSSGHLIIARQIFGVNDLGGLTYDAILQLATGFSLVVYFRRDIYDLLRSFFNLFSKKETNEEEKVLLYSIILGTIPAIIFGLLLESKMDTIFRSVNLVAVTLISGSLLLYLAQKFAKENKPLTLKRGIVIGFFQCLALVPGISRSGSTISGGLISGLSKEKAVRFSFLLSIPIVLGSGLKKLLEVRGDLFTSDLGLSLLIGVLTAFVSGLFAINFLIKYLKNHSLNLFIWYRVILAIILIFFLY